MSESLVPKSVKGGGFFTPMDIAPGEYPPVMKDNSWIETFVKEYISPKHTHEFALPCTACDAHKAIEAELVRIIGEDENDYRPNINIAGDDRNKPVRNLLRAEQRERAGINLKGGASDEHRYL